MTKVQNSQVIAKTATLTQAAMLWQLGDWPELAAVAVDDASEAAALLPFKVVALMQQGQTAQARALITSSPMADHKPLLRTLLSGALNSLAKAHACNLNHGKAETLFTAAVELATDSRLTKSVCQARINQQLQQLAIPALPVADSKTEVADVGYFLQKALAYFPDNAALQIALAEHYQQHEQFDSAIVSWQQVSALLNADMPQPYYDRLKQAYQAVKSFPLGTEQQEHLSGQIDKHQFLAQLHQKLKPEFYFEIGVQTGKSLALAKCEAIGVDPMPLLNVKLSEQAKVITSSSDSFFAQKCDMLLHKKIDLAFIDGMHLFEYALRDFINTERFASPHSIIVMDDIFPGHPDQAKRDRCTRAWTGDVWKVKKILQQYRPDLLLVAVDAHPTGLLLITGLDPTNQVLQQNYQTIIEQYMALEQVPADIMRRSDALTGMDNKVVALLQLLQAIKLHPEKNQTLHENWASL